MGYKTNGRTGRQMTFLIIKPCDIYLWIQWYTYPDDSGPASNENTAFSINHSIYL